MMAVNLDSVEYSKERQVNRNRKVTFYRDGGTIKQHYNPVPYDYVFTVSIAAEYMVDITQIIEQVLPFFTPEAYIRITIPELNISGASADDEAGSEKLELRVIYESSQKDAPVELDEAGYRILLWNLTFRVHGYLFSPIYEGKPIHSVVQNYYTKMETTDTTDLVIGEIGDKVVQGLIYATNIPEEGVPIDDDVRSMFAYEHFEEPPNTNYVFNDNMVWIQDDDGNPIDDDIDRNVRE
jgi:hypothetical protein